MFEKNQIEKHLNILKYLLPVIVFSILYFQLEPELKNLNFQFVDFTEIKILYISLLIFLMSINWLLESLKWMFLVNKITVISFSNSLKSIVNGLAFGLITPFKVGEIFTRILHIDSKNRSKALGSLLVSRVSQLITTCFFGLLGLTYFFITYLKMPIFIWFITAILIVIIFMIYFNLRLIIPFLAKFNFTSNYIHYIDVMFDYNNMDYFKVLFFSICRYTVFIIQYYLMFILYDIEVLPRELFTGISIVFFVKSILPLSILGDVGIRELTAVTIFGLMGFYKPIILLITISVWILNIVIPSVIGSFLTKKG